MGPFWRRQLYWKTLNHLYFSLLWSSPEGFNCCINVLRTVNLMDSTLLPVYTLSTRKENFQQPITMVNKNLQTFQHKLLFSLAAGVFWNDRKRITFLLGYMGLSFLVLFILKLDLKKRLLSLNYLENVEIDFYLNEALYIHQFYLINSLFST